MPYDPDMPCQLCGSPAHSGKNHDFRSFLGRLGTADREKLLRAATATRSVQPAPSGRWLEATPEGLRVADPAQCANHSEPSDVIRQPE